MRIVICSKRDLEGNIAVNKLIRELYEHELFIILSDEVMEKEREIKESSDCVFYERDLLIDHVFPLLERSPHKPHPLFFTFKQIQEHHGIPIHIMGNINGGEGEKLLTRIQPDLILSVRYDYIFKKHIISIPRLGILNIHPGKLPTYRGVYALFRAMLNGDAHAGVTLHYVDECIDTGPIVAIGYLHIDYSKSFLWHLCQLYPLGIDIFLEHLPNLEAGRNLSAQSQQSDGNYYTFPTSEEFLLFSQKGGILIDFNDYLEIIFNYNAPLREVHNSFFTQGDSLYTNHIHTREGKRLSLGDFPI